MEAALFYSCTFCHKRFKEKRLLKYHQKRTHFNTSRFSCFVCQKVFNDKRYMTSHLFIHDDARKSELEFVPEEMMATLILEGGIMYEGKEIMKDFVCSYCRKVFDRKHSKDRHEKNHSGEKLNECKMDVLIKDVAIEVEPEIQKSASAIFKCKLDCTDKFPTLKQLLEHTLKGNHNGTFFFTCSKCPQKFSSTKVMKNHTCLLIAKTDIEENLVPTHSYISKNTVSMFSPSSKNTVHNYTSIGKTNVPLRSSYKINKKPKAEQYNCSQCDTSLPSTTSLDIHLKIHEERRNIICNYADCSKKFSTYTELRTHKDSEHSTKHSCKICEKEWNSHHELRKHMTRHSIEKNFICTTCGKGFKSEPALKHHILGIHKGFLSSCNVCGQSFTSPSGLTNHKRNKHSTEQVRICAECQKTFGNKYILKEHMKTHTDERNVGCRQEGCGKKFKTHEVRKRHEDVHNDVKENQCQLCPKLFREKFQLALHMKRHNGVKDHLCVTCGREFVEPAGARNCKHSKKA